MEKENIMYAEAHERQHRHCGQKQNLPAMQNCGEQYSREPPTGDAFTRSILFFFFFFLLSCLVPVQFHELPLSPSFHVL